LGEAEVAEEVIVEILQVAPLFPPVAPCGEHPGQPPKIVDRHVSPPFRRLDLSDRRRAMFRRGPKRSALQRSPGAS
jgi:hypothetical protein